MEGVIEKGAGERKNSGSHIDTPKTDGRDKEPEHERPGSHGHVGKGKVGGICQSHTVGRSRLNGDCLGRRLDGPGAETDEGPCRQDGISMVRLTKDGQT